jgi:hypothetical protein
LPTLLLMERSPWLPEKYKLKYPAEKTRRVGDTIEFAPCSFDLSAEHLSRLFDARFSTFVEELERRKTVYQRDSSYSAQRDIDQGKIQEVILDSRGGNSTPRPDDHRNTCCQEQAKL